MYQRPSAPLSIGQLLDEGFKLFRVSFVKVLPLVVATAALSVVFAFFQTPTPDELPFSFRTIVTAIIMWGLSLFLAIAQIAIIAAVADGRDLSIGDALTIGESRFIAFVGASVLYGLAMLVGAVLLVVPMIILSVTLSMSFYAVVLDGKQAVPSLRYSHELVWGNWWYTATALSVVVAVVVALYMVAMLAGSVLFAAGGLDLSRDLSRISFIANVGGSLLSAMVSPFLYAAGLAIYHDLKLRRGETDGEAGLLTVE